MAALEKLVYLQSQKPQNGRSKRNVDPDKLAKLMLQQDEMFNLAQVVGLEFFPDVQIPLDAARREVMHLIEEHRAEISGAVMSPTPKRIRNERWFDHQITPEVSRDIAMTGLIVPRELAKRLVQLHRLQISALTDLMIRGRF